MELRYYVVLNGGRDENNERTSEGKDTRRKTVCFRHAVIAAIEGSEIETEGDDYSDFHKGSMYDDLRICEVCDGS